MSTKMNLFVIRKCLTEANTILIIIHTYQTTHIEIKLNKELTLKLAKHSFKSMKIPKRLRLNQLDLTRPTG